MIEHDPLLAKLRRHQPGPVVLSPSRWVWWTGRLAIGLKHQRPDRGYPSARCDSDARVIQDLLICEVK